MKTDFTAEEIIKNKGCYDNKKINNLFYNYARTKYFNSISVKLNQLSLIFNIMSYKDIQNQIKNIIDNIDNQKITIDDILKSNISILDKRWFVSNNCELKLEEKKKLFLEILEIGMPLWQKKLSIFLNENKNKEENSYEIYNITYFAKAMESSLKDMYDSALRDIVYFIITCDDKIKIDGKKLLEIPQSNKILETYIKFFNR